MSEQLPMFPLGAVLFPGVSLPLTVFEDRYRALIGHLLTVPDPTARHFGSVGIREGWEVGEHGAQSLFRVGVRLQLTEVNERPGGGFEVEATALGRIRLDRMEAPEEFPVGEVTDLTEPDVTVPAELTELARATFTAYRAALLEFREDPYSGTLPRDPEYLSWTLAACAPLPMAERQQLLEAPDAAVRLELVTAMLRHELRAMNVIPSLPATEVARTRWSPN